MALPVGIVGAGRTRNGLGPFLATFFEDAGFRVAAVTGRSAERADASAAAIGAQLDHPVAPCRDLQTLCGSGIAALVVASPPEYHLEALQAAFAAGLPVFCEKPLVHEEHGEAGESLVAKFMERRLLLVENCHWPLYLPALRTLYGDPAEGAVRRLALGMMSARPGRAIVQNTLSHLLSLAQGVADLGMDAAVEDVSVDRPSLMLTPNVVRCRLRGPRTDLELSLHLDLCSTTPRPAWLAIDDIRMERRVGPGYAASFVSGEREVAVPDPMPQLVAGFAARVKQPDPTGAVAESERILQRLRLYRAVMARVA